MDRTTAIVFGVAGTLALIGAGLFSLVDPVYYDADSVLDYASVVTLSGVFLLTAVALGRLWRDPPVRRGAGFLLVAAIGAAAIGIGNLLEDAFDVESAVWLFFAGGITMLIALPIAAVAALTVASRDRWGGAFLLFAVPGAMLGFGLVMLGVAWLLFALWIVTRRRAFVLAIGVATLPAVVTAVWLYGGDVISTV